MVWLMLDPTVDYRAVRAMIVGDLRRGGEKGLAALVESDEINDEEIEAIRQRMHEIDINQRLALLHLDHTQSIGVQALTVMAARDVLQRERGEMTE
jgi:hypothetical protein